MADTTKAAVADAPASHCSPAWSALIHDEDRIRTISPQELMPIFQGMMKGGCKACPKDQTTACQNIEKPFVVLGHDVVRSMFSMPWEFKAEDIIAGGASERAGSPAEALEIMQRWLDNSGELLVERARHARGLGRPRAAYEVAELAWAAAGRGPYASPDGEKLPRLTSLLNLFNLPRGD